MITERISRYYHENYLLDEERILYMEYALKSIANELIKTVTFAVYFALLNKLKLFLFVGSIFISLRWVSGGIHCKTFWGCFVGSFLTINALVFLPLLLPEGIDLTIILLIVWAGGVAAWKKVPCTAPIRPIHSSNLKRRLRIVFIILFSAWTIVLFIIRVKTAFYVCGTSTLFFHVVQLYYLKKGANKL